MEQLTGRIISLLQEAGLHAVAEMPQTVAPRLEAPACAVQLEKATISPPGFAQYLGMIEDPVHGSTELYGARLESVVAVWIYSPTELGGDGCMDAARSVIDALMAQRELPLRGLSVVPCSYDARYDHFCAKVLLELQEWIYAESADEAQRFINFNLRGEFE